MHIDHITKKATTTVSVVLRTNESSVWEPRGCSKARHPYYLQFNPWNAIFIHAVLCKSEFAGFSYRTSLPRFFCDIMDPVSFLHPDPWQLPPDSDPPKPFLKSIPVPSAIAPSKSMDWITINKPSCFTVVNINLSVLSFTIIVFYCYIDDRLLWMYE